MKTVREYEPSDIDLKDPVHGFLSAALLIFALNMTKVISPEDAERWLKERIAAFLTLADKSGVSITKVEEVPAVFVEGMER